MLSCRPIGKISPGQQRLSRSLRPRSKQVMLPHSKEIG